MTAILIPISGSAAAATQSKYEALGAVSFLIRLRADELSALADSGSVTYSTIVIMSGKANLRLAITRGGSTIYFTTRDDNEGVTSITSFALASLPSAGNFVNLYGFRRDGAGAGGGTTSAIAVYSGVTLLGSASGTVSLGSLATGAGAGTLSFGGSAALGIDAAYVCNRALTATEIQTEPTTALSGLVGGYPIKEGTGGITADMISGGTALSLSSATWDASGTWNNAGGGADAVLLNLLRRRRAA